MLDWITCLSTFVHVVELKSFSHTAKKLHTSPSAITKRINWLEDHLETQLLIRTTRTLKITESGQTLYERGLHLLDSWQDTKTAVHCTHQIVSGTLRVGVPTGFGSQRLVDLLPSFLEQYPDLKVDLKLSNCLSELDGSQIDIYICSSLIDKDTEQYNQKTITSISNQIYAAPSYLATQGAPSTLAELSQHNCITVCYEGMDNWMFDGEALPVSGSLSTNNSVAGIRAALAGIGLLSICGLIITEYIQTGQLVPVLPEHHSDTKNICAYYPKQHFVPKKTLAFLDFITTYFLANPYQTV